jgi:hypothetical protein
MPNDSCHPREHKTAAIRYFCDRMKTYKLTPESRQKEENTVQQILVNNNYDVSTLNKFSKEKKQKRDTQKEKWAKFTYVGKETRFITKLFKNTNVKVRFATINTIERRLATKLGTDQNKYDKSGIYQLSCPNCKKKYTGQTLQGQISGTFKAFQVWEQQVEICPAPPRKQTCNWSSGSFNGHHPHNQQGQNDRHVRKALHL